MFASEGPECIFSMFCGSRFLDNRARKLLLLYFLKRKKGEKYAPGGPRVSMVPLGYATVPQRIFGRLNLCRAWA